MNSSIMNPHDIMWDSCKRSVPDVSLVKEHDKNEYCYSRAGFPLSSTPPKARNDVDLRNELSAIKVELEKLQREQERSKEYAILKVISEQLADVRAELAEVKKQNAVLAEQKCKCRERQDQRKSKELEMLQSVSQQLVDLRTELGRTVDESNEKVVVDKEVQVCCSVAEQFTQTMNVLPMPMLPTDNAVRPSPPIVEFQHRPPLVVKKPNVPQSSDLSMTANKILQKYLPDEPIASPKPLWRRQMEYENLIFNISNVSVAMQRQQRNEPWPNPSKPLYEERSPYSPNFENYRHPAHRMDEYEELEPCPPQHEQFWPNPSQPRYDDWPYDYRQPVEPVRPIPADYDDPQPEWRGKRPKPKLIGLSAIMNQPKLL